jgi:hypothetical protein
MAGALRDVLLVLLTTVGTYVLVGVAFAGSFYALTLVPGGLQAAVCGEAFFCWPGLVLALVVSMAVTVGVVGGLTSRGYLRVPDAW